jgi:hypothetical protein
MKALAYESTGLASDLHRSKQLFYSVSWHPVRTVGSCNSNKSRLSRCESFLNYKTTSSRWRASEQ